MDKEITLFSKPQKLRSENEYLKPAIYLREDPELDKTLAAKKKKTEDALAKCKAEKLKYFFVFFAVFAAAFFAASLVVMLVLSFELRYLWAAAIISLAAGLIAGLMFAKDKYQKSLKRATRLADEYREERIAQKAYEHLFNTFRFSQLANVIMGGGNLTVSYIDEEGKQKVDTFHYDEYDDEDLQEPFLLFDGNHLYGKSGDESQSTYFTTSIVGYNDEDED